MPRYIYPAVFTQEDDGGYCVNFPDVEGCYTQGNTLEEALDMAKDVLCLMLYTAEEDGLPINKPSDIKTLTIDNNSFVTLISCDTLEYRKFFDNKAIKKTLTIPNWLNIEAERCGINFSQTLQEALKQKLNIC